MISFIKGYVEHIIDNYLLLDCNGVGYKIYMTSSSVSEVSHAEAGVQIKVYTYMYLTEGQVTLYGFLSLEEYDLFEMLITVSGVGPKAAMAVLSTAPPSQLLLYIATEDADMLAKAHGIGAKTASRIVLELKDKAVKKPLPSHVMAQGTIDSAAGTPANDAIDALISLGYPKNEAIKAVSQADLNMPVEKIIKTALKKIIENR